MTRDGVARRFKVLTGLDQAPAPALLSSQQQPDLPDTRSSSTKQMRLGLKGGTQAECGKGQEGAPTPRGHP